MSSYIYAKLIETEPFMNRVRIVGQYAQSSPEQDAFYEEEIFPEDDQIRLSSSGNAYDLSRVCDEVRICLPKQLLASFEMFLSTLLPSLLGKAKVGDTRYYAELKKLELTGWILDREDVNRIKAASDFLSFLRERREQIATQIKATLEEIDCLIEYIGECVRILDLAIERDCGLLIYQL